MKASELIAKLRSLPPDADVTEIDVRRLFDDDSVPWSIQDKIEKVKAYLAAGDLNGLREFVKEETASLPSVNI